MAHTYRDLPSAGTSIEIDTGGYVYEVINGATDITWDGYSRGVRTPTPLSGTHVVKKPGMSNYGQLKAKVFYDPNDTQHQAIEARLRQTAAYASANIDNWRINWADGYDTPAYVEYEGFVSSFSPSATDPETGTLTCDLTIEVTDVLDVTPGAPAE